MGLRLVFNASQEGDLELSSDGTLASDEGLDTYVTICLGTDARATDEERADISERRGYWADAYAEDPDENTGSKIWLLENETLTPATLEQLIAYADEALEIMVSDGIASRVVTTGEIRADAQGADMETLIYRPGSDSPYTFTWEARFAV